MPLSVEQQILIEQRITNEAKSMGVAYLLWFFLWFIGAHRFYLGKVQSAYIMIAMVIVGSLLAPVGFGFIFLAALALWGLVDAFLIPGMVQENKQSIRNALAMQFSRQNDAVPYSDMARNPAP